MMRWTVKPSEWSFGRALHLFWMNFSRTCSAMYFELMFPDCSMILSTVSHAL